MLSKISYKQTTVGSTSNVGQIGILPCVKTYAPRHAISAWVRFGLAIIRIYRVWPQLTCGSALRISRPSSQSWHSQQENLGDQPGLTALVVLQSSPWCLRTSFWNKHPKPTVDLSIIHRILRVELSPGQSHMLDIRYNRWCSRLGLCEVFGEPEEYQDVDRIL